MLFQRAIVMPIISVPKWSVVYFILTLNEHPLYFTLLHFTKVQQVVAFDLASKLKTYDALLTPAAPTAAYCLENKVI